MQIKKKNQGGWKIEIQEKIIQRDGLIWSHIGYRTESVDVHINSWGLAFDKNSCKFWKQV